MTGKVEVVRAWHTAGWANPPESTLEADKTYLSDEFKSLDRNGNVILDKNLLMGMTKLVLSAFKDFKSVFHEMREEGDGVLVRFHWEGTHTVDFDMSPMGLGVIPASGKKVVWPEASTMYFVEGDKIVGSKEITGGMEWFLAPLGVKLPSA